MANETLTDAALSALRTVIDPEIGYNIVDLGLVYDVAAENGTVRVCMTTTRPGCPATDMLKEGAEAALAQVEGIGAVNIEMTWMPPWSPDLMSDVAKAALGF